MMTSAGAYAQARDAAGVERLQRHCLRPCLAQFNFNTKVVFLENSFMSKFLDEAELFGKSVW